MTPVEELALVDAEWDAISESVAERPSAEPNASPAASSDPLGAFGHASERRLGLRVPATCWALLNDGAEGTYARTVELSATGVILKLLDGKKRRFDGARYELDIFVPGVNRPIRATARPARAIGALQAFEFSNMNAVDRLTLAEHLDDLVVERAATPASEAGGRTASPPLAWRRFVLSLKQPRTPAPPQRF